MKITSVFENGGDIPKKYTCEGDGVSPPFDISGVPEKAKSLAIISYDSNVPLVVQKKTGIKEWTHWVAFNIDPEIESIKEGEKIGVQGKNGSGHLGYEGPCPPKDLDPPKHKYTFILYALDKKLSLKSGTDRESLEDEMKKHILKKTKLVGYYEKSE